MEFVARYLKNPQWRRQHKWRRAIWMMLARVGLTGAHALPLNRRWVEIHRRTMPLAHLDPAFNGFKIAQISDLHYSPVVWSRYLVQLIRWVNDLKPDMVVVTGDLITGGYNFATRVARLLGHLQSTYGTLCTLGNHDYSMYGHNGSAEGERRANFLETSLRRRGLDVLRNQTKRLLIPGAAKPLVIVGLDDEWSGHIDPRKAFAGVAADDAVVCLNHNPANVWQLMDYPWQWMLSGHTHGRQTVSGPFARTFYPQRYRHYTHGYYCLRGRHLYVNRGLSYGQRVFEWCRPEITLFRIVAK